MTVAPTSPNQAVLSDPSWLAPSTGAAPTGTALLELNLAFVARRCPRAADRIRRAMPAFVRFEPTDEPGAPTVELAGRWLASRRKPREEARRFAESVNIQDAAAIAVMGFGLGYHIEALVHRLRRTGFVLAYEPDVALLRAVFETIDCTSWLAGGNVLLAVDAEDAASLAATLSGLEAFVAAGVEIVRHPASEPRVSPHAPAFGETLARTVAAMRTHIITTMVQSDVTIRNALMNLDVYAGRAGGHTGIDDLRGAFAGAPAIVVSAGPSLARNIELLSDPRVHERCVIIAVQTVLKPLLARGIRPHFVTALDYHEISRRFYEGLTADDVRGVTLVAEPKANGAILDAFPGAIRLVSDDFNHTLLGAELAPTLGTIQPGATVAHLAYYFARHLGCDPVMLVGQDLAFTDGQYYAAGAAIHDVWAPELNAFNTLEMMEWQRIVRMRSHLHEKTDQLGRKVYADDQMTAYLAQFERDFLADAERGMTVIDATEGGVRKAHTHPLPLRDALDRFVTSRPPLPTIPDAPRRGQIDAARVSRLKKHLAKVRTDVRRIVGLCFETSATLERMIAVQHDTARINALIGRSEQLRDQVKALEPAWTLVQKMNQTGTFKRFKADRAIELAADLSPVERQTKQIERDIMNVQWLRETAEVLDDLLGASIGVLEGKPRRTRDAVPKDDPSASSADRPAAKTQRTVGVILAFDGSAQRPFAGRPALALTLERLARTEGLSNIAVITDDADACRAIVAGAKLPARPLVIGVSRAERHPRAAAVAAARRFTPHSWRGGIAGLTAHDEVFDAPLILRALDELNADAALFAGADWCLIDPRLASELLARHRENPGANPLVFTQAPPGLAPMLIARPLLSDLAAAQNSGDSNATIGTLLGYTPLRARADPIAKPCCVQIDPLVRSAAQRFIADTASIELLEAALAASGLNPASASASADQIVAAMHSHLSDHSPAAPGFITLELADHAGRFIDESLARRIISAIASFAPHAALTLRAATSSPADAMDHPAWSDLIRAAKDAGLAVHARTMLRRDDAPALALAAEPDVLSIDCIAGDAVTYAQLTGRSDFERVMNNVEAVLAARAENRSPMHVVPRLTRRDEVYDAVENFIDRSLVFAGAAVLDPLDRPQPGARIQPFEKPRAAFERDWRTRLWIDAAGCVRVSEHPDHPETAGSITSEPLADLWRRVVERRLAAHRASPAARPPELWTGW